MDIAMQQVTDFHRALGAPISPRPRLLEGSADEAAAVAGKLRALAIDCGHLGGPSSILLSRLAMELEELAEWAEAHAAGDLVAAADAWGDRLYVLLGDGVAAGLPAQAIFDEVHRSNMTKVSLPPDGSGKARKDRAFVRPHLAPLLGL